MIAQVLAGCLVALAGDGVSASEARALRAVLTEAIAEPDARARARLVREAEVVGELAGRDFAALVEAVRAGPLVPEDGLAPRAGERFETFGAVLSGPTFRFDGEVYGYDVSLPRKYDAGAPCPVLLDPGHGTGKGSDQEGKAGFLDFYRRQADAAGGRGWVLVRTEIVERIGGDGADGERPEEVTARAFDACFRDLATRVALDPDRVRVAGLSQTGYWAWYLARFRADRWAGIAPMSASSWAADSYLANLLHVPVATLHGDADHTVPVSGARATTAALAALGTPVRHVELEGAGHDVSVWNELPGALAWLAERPRDPYPKRVSKSFETLADPWCYWLRVDALGREGDGRAQTPPTAGIDGVIEGQRVELYSEGVERATLFLSGELLDLDQPVEVRWNGRKVHAGKVERSLEVLVLTAADKVDWRGTYEAALELRP